MTVNPLLGAMMLPTHALVGLAIAAPLAVAMPELGSVALGGALVGSLLPDVDLYSGHRRTLHYPTGYVFLAGLAVIAAAVLATPAAVAAAFVFVGAAVHCRMDRYGGGLELRPWEGTSDRAVYDHLNGRWLAPRRWIPYDGAPEDLLLAGTLSVPAFVVFGGDPSVRAGLLGILAVSVVWVALRRRVAAVSERLAASLPASLRPFVPERFLTADER